MGKPYKLPLDVCMLRVGSLKKATIVDYNHKCIAGSISLIDDMVDKVYDQYGEFVTAVNAYERLKAENDKLRKALDDIQKIIYLETEAVATSAYKKINQIILSAVEFGGEQ